MKRLKQIRHILLSILASKKFFWGIVIIFSIASFWFAVSIRHSIPPDEVHHYKLIQVYSSKPISEGPFISNQTEETAFLGDIERLPDYLYHFTLGQIDRAVMAFSDSGEVRLTILRIVNILLAVTGLFIFWLTFRRLGSLALANMTIFALSIMGTFLWLSASVNYDNAIFLVSAAGIFLFVRAMQDRRAIDVLGLLAILGVGILTKRTFLVIALSILFVLLLQLITHKGLKKDLVDDTKKLLKQPKMLIPIVLVLVVLGGLFVERYVYNQISYGSVKPACEKVHSESFCLNNSIYRRNKEFKASTQAFLQEGGEVNYDPFNFAGDWFDKMYDGLFFYFGHKNINAYDKVKNVFAILAVSSIAIILLYKKPKRVLRNDIDRSLFAITIAYFVSVFLYNLNFYLSHGAKFAFQGRYLLPLMPIFLFYLIRAFVSSFSSMKGIIKRITIVYFCVLCLLFAYYHFPISAFYRGSDYSWYNERTRGINIRIQDVLSDIRVAPEGSYEYIQ